MLAVAVLAATALAAGLTGTWSPCGFSMLATLGPSGHTGGRRTTVAACATFALGALAGGAATFTTLSYLGRALGGGGSRAATAAAVAVALAAALGEARGVRVLPQVRRQVPEHWRRVMPLALAGGLYGVLLGLGFTTFVLTLAVWALAGVSVAVGDPVVGLVIGVAFGAGRALPVVVLAPWLDGERGIRCAEMMAERPIVLRSLRLLDGLLLLLSAIALGAGAGAGTALAAVEPTPVAAGATDPTLGGGMLAWAAPGGASGMVIEVAGAPPRQLGGADPALGGPYLAVHNGAEVTVSAGPRQVGQVAIPGVEQLAVSSDWLVARAADPGGAVLLYALPLPDLAPMTLVAAEPSGTDLGRPAIDGSRVVAAVNAPRSSRIFEFDLRRHTRRVLRSSRGSQLLNPSLLGGKLLYERATYCDQRLVLGSPDSASGARVLLRLGGAVSRDAGHEPGHTRQGSEPSRCPRTLAATQVSLWTTALASDGAYVTELTPRAGGPPSAALLALPLG